MRRMLIYLIIGVLAVLGVIWFFTADEPPPVMQPTEERHPPPGLDIFTPEDLAEHAHERMEA
ncbi:hypothetical protein [Desulfonatronum parangueonense]